jgi:release factor glutamine methyltransferase
MHEVTFNGLSFAADPGTVMTPRKASEQLVAAAQRALFRRARSPRVVDVGTGSGAIAVGIASASPNAQVFATDTSRWAVALARVNAYRHGLSERITVYQGDLLEPVDGPIDVVVANLPYLPEEHAERYPDLAAEPADAVFAPGDGLYPYRRLLTACAERLDDDAAVLIQLHRRLLTGTGADLAALRARVESFAPVPALVAA